MLYWSTVASERGSTSTTHRMCTLWTDNSRAQTTGSSHLSFTPNRAGVVKDARKVSERALVFTSVMVIFSCRKGVFLKSVG